VNVQAAYNHWSASYDQDRNLTRDLDAAVTRQTLAPFRCRSLLEIGCGTGKNTPLLAGLGKRVCGLDFSTGMLRRAKAKVADPHVSFAVADLTRPWPCAAQSVDLITCSLVLEHIADLDFVFSEAARVLMAGGRIFVCELHPFRQYQGAVATFQREQGTTEIPAFVHHLSDFVHAAERAFTLERFDEWWHADDAHKPPRLASFIFGKK
jgi:malonyl-CoA O-methyltransferase